MNRFFATNVGGCPVVNEIATGLRGDDRTVNEVVSRAVQTLHRHFPQFRASYSTVDSDGRITILASVQPGGEPATQVVATPLVLRPDQIERLLRSDLYQVDDVTKDIAWSKLSEVLGKIGTAALLDAPTRHPGVRTGLLSFSSSVPHAWTDLEKGALRDAADFLASTVEDVRQRLLLKESEARVRTLLEQNGDGVAVLLDGHVAYSNPAMTKMFGYDAEEFVSLDPLALIAPRHRARAIERITGITSGDSVTGLNEYEGERKDGTTFPLEVMSRRILRDGRPALLSTMRDLTEKKKAEAEVRRSEARLHSLLENHFDGVAVVANGRLVYVNRSLAAMFGYEQEDLVDRDPLTLVREDERSVAAERMRGLVKGAAVKSVEYTGLRKDGSTFPLEVLGQATDYGGYNALLATFRDLTDRKRAESATREAEAKYRTLVERSLAGVYVVQNRRFVYVNPKLAEIMGYDQSELLALPSAVAAIVADDRDIVEEKMTQEW